MSVKVILPYKPGVNGLFFVVIDVEDGGKYLNGATGLFETYNSNNVGFYRNQFIDATGEPGSHAGLIPDIAQASLPKYALILCYDPATKATDGPIGSGYVQIDKTNNEVNSDLLLSYVFSSTVGHNLGVGTAQEQYYGHDGFLAFTTAFDASGNRQVTLAQG